MIGIGLGLTMARGAGALRVPSYLPTLTAASPRGTYSHCVLLVSAYTGPLCRLSVAGGTITQDFSPNATTKLLDYAAVIAWRDANGGGTIRIDTVYHQDPTNGTETGRDATQATDIDKPILDPANYQSDGFWPASFTGYAASTANEQNLFLTVGASLAHNQANHTQIAIIDNMSNVAVSGTNNLSIQSIGASGATRNEMNVGNHSFAGQFGLNLNWGSGPTKTYPGTVLLVPVNRSVVSISITTSTNALNVIDGIGPPAASHATLSFDVNGERYSQDITRSTGASTGMRIGSGISGTDTGAAFRWYGSIVYDNNVETAGLNNGYGAGQLPYLITQLKTIYAINTTYTSHILMVGSSSPAGYRSNARGLSMQLRPLLDGNARVDVIAMAGTTSATIHTNRAAISALRKAALGKTAIILSGAMRNDLTAGTTGATTYSSYVGPIMSQWTTDGWGWVGVSTLVTSVTGGVPSQATFDTERAALNSAITNSANIAANGNYNVIDTAADASLQDYTNTTYFDPDQIHLNDAAGAPISANKKATALNAYL